MALMIRTLLFAILFCALAPGARAAATPVPVQRPDTVFRHASHREFQCYDCHTMQSQHGDLLVRGTADCRGCHHTGERIARGCVACHEGVEVAALVLPVTRAVHLTVGDIGSVEREISFDHSVHEARDCVECHSEGEPTLSAASVDCNSCHVEHHEAPETGCWACHVRPPPEAHPAEVHTTCSGAGCHVDSPIQETPRTRVGCLLCHEEQRDHEPEGDCVDCHFVSGPPASSPYVHPRTPHADP